jgi:hypothetical protein
MSKYQVMKGQELAAMLKPEAVTDYTEDSATGARIYFLNTGKILLFPAEAKKGLLIEDKATLDSLLKTGIPIEDELGPFGKTQAELANLEANIGTMLKRLEAELKVPVNINDTSEEYYKSLNKAIKQYGYENFYNNLFVEFGVFIGEKLRKDYMLEWGVEKRYKAKPYLEPVLLTKEKMSVTPFYKLADALLEKKKFNFSQFYENVDMYARVFRATPRPKE